MYPSECGRAELPAVGRAGSGHAGGPVDNGIDGARRRKETLMRTVRTLALAVLLALAAATAAPAVGPALIPHGVQSR